MKKVRHLGFLKKFSGHRDMCFKNGNVPGRKGRMGAHFISTYTLGPK
jgi:hypothetical protein